MKILLTLFLLLIVLFLVVGVMLSLASRQGAPAGLLDGRLQPCPGTPNCVCSEYPQTAAYVEPVRFEGDARAAWDRAQTVVNKMGGEVSQVTDGYLAATFESTLFRFVDDVEMRLDESGGVIHIRSASRVGRSDLGVNRKRVETLRRRFTELASGEKVPNN